MWKGRIGILLISTQDRAAAKTSQTPPDYSNSYASDGLVAIMSPLS
jgi:hypothetical protein